MPEEKNPKRSFKNKKNKFRPYRKIFATVKNETFLKFKKRCEKEGMDDFGNALSEIIEMYANGATINFPEEENETKTSNNNKN